jgi:hypothetical protein
MSIYIPKEGEICTLKKKDGRVFVFRSDGGHHSDIHTYHRNAICIYCGNDSWFKNWRSTNRGCQLGSDDSIEYLRLSNENEIEIFKHVLNE